MPIAHPVRMHWIAAHWFLVVYYTVPAVSELGGVGLLVKESRETGRISA